MHKLCDTSHQCLCDDDAVDVDNDGDNLNQCYIHHGDYVNNVVNTAAVTVNLALSSTNNDNNVSRVFKKKNHRHGSQLMNSCETEARNVYAPDIPCDHDRIIASNTAITDGGIKISTATSGGTSDPNHLSTATYQSFPPYHPIYSKAGGGYYGKAPHSKGDSHLVYKFEHICMENEMIILFCFMYLF